MTSKSITAAVRSLGHALPRVIQKDTPFVLYRRVGPMLHISGMIAQFEGSRPFTGRLGAELNVADGKRAAELSALNILAWLAEATDDDAERVECCLELNGYVASTPDFKDHSPVIGGASNLVVAVLGERGRHTRTSVGVASLPFGVAVEINAKFVLTR